MNDTECAQQALEETHISPKGIDPVTKMLPEECSIMHLSMPREEVCAFVTAEDYNYHWKRTKEHRSASYSKLYFGHYIAAADIKTLSKLHAAKLSEVARRGVTLEGGKLG